MSNEESVFMRLEYTDREFRTIMDAMSVGGRPGMMWQRNAIEERRERNRRRTQEETERREAEQQSQRHQLQNRQAQQQAAQAAAQARAIEAQEQEQMHQQALEAIAGEHVRRQDSDTALSPIVDRDDERTRLERVRAQLAGRIDRRNSDDLILI
jgi:FtsZ-interacting cell division protein ZipA